MTVGSVPPSPYEAGPGSEPALSGPMRIWPSRSTLAMDPPPAPISIISITDEVHQSVEERLAHVLGVVPPGKVIADAHELGPDEGEASALQARDDLAHQATLDRVRLQ